MGKTQSKRSVDITTETKKGSEQEGTGKLEKIEDVDQKQVNGDASPQETNDVEKKETDESEHDKDLTTEKSAAETAQQALASGDGDQNTATATNSAVASETKDDVAAAATAAAGTKNEDETEAAAESISPLADESINKKAKKEKVKKKWSFRSISFGKKDKQKPAKTEETNDNAAVTNGEAAAADKTAAQEGVGTTDDATKKDEDKPAENGNATEKELNGDKTPTTPTADEKKTVAAAVNSSVETTNTTVTNSASNNETATNDNQTVKKIAGDIVEKIEAATTAIMSNGNAADAEKNGVVEDTDDTNNKASIPAAINDADVDKKPQQNGTNDAEELVAATEPEKIKSQIEEIACAKDLKEIAAVAENTTQQQDLPVTCE